MRSPAISPQSSERSAARELRRSGLALAPPSRRRLPLTPPATPQPEGLALAAPRAPSAGGRWSPSTARGGIPWCLSSPPRAGERSEPASAVSQRASGRASSKGGPTRRAQGSSALRRTVQANREPEPAPPADDPPVDDPPQLSRATAERGPAHDAPGARERGASPLTGGRLWPSVARPWQTTQHPLGRRIR